MTIDKEQFKEAIRHRIDKDFAKTLETASKTEIYRAVSRTALDLAWENWISTRNQYRDKDVKQAYYLSAEFLMGRAMSNNLVNMTVLNEVKDALEELGINFNEVEDQEPDAGLGNGGLGRLAACFLDSLATLELPGHGYGIRYKYGMFEQHIEDQKQVEYPDNWLKNGDPWSIKRADEAVEVKFGGQVDVLTDEKGRQYFKRVGADIITAVPYDMPIIGYDTKTVNTLRLWQAEAPDGFDLQLFNDEEYTKAVEKQNRAEDISRVLYPNDRGPQGKALRLKQQYFFVSASLQDIVKKYKKKHGDDFSRFADTVAIQLNDTHPVVAIPELMRIFMDWEKMEWEEAWSIVTQTCAYTNHTILAEALEKWPLDLYSSLLPRIYQITEEINRRFLTYLRSQYPGDWGRHGRMAIIGEGVVKMAWLAIAGSHSVNGVAALHTEILKNQELKDWYELFPEKFNNKTNGITQRRWLLKSNPLLADFITQKIGKGWTKDLSQLSQLKQKASDEASLKELMEIKRKNKEFLADYIKEQNGIDVDVSSIFDVQVKRLHEYKRQLLNILHVMDLYNKIKEDPSFDVYPRTFIFGAKAASGYRRAKQIIHLICRVAETVNNDPDVKGRIKVVFLENYRVSLAEKIFPASDISEQISTAGKEASGTGNMKFMLNGAMTLGTLDGANIEIVEEAGETNAFIFGLKSEEVAELNRTHGYNPWTLLEEQPSLKKVLNQLVDGTYSKTGEFQEIYNSLVHGAEGNPPDQYYVIKDFADYARAQRDVEKAYKDSVRWSRMALANIAGSGKFSSDRTIRQYADEIWNIKPCHID